MKQQKAAIVIPMYNEEKIAEKCINAVVKTLDHIKQPILLIIINDGSTDNTAEILQQKQAQYKKRLVVVTHKKNKGFGAGNQTGMKKAIALGYDWVLHMDAGLTNDPKYIPAFLSFTNGPYDCIKASRYIKGAKVQGVPTYRRIISICGNHIARRLFRVGIKDCTNGFRMIRLAKVKGLTCKESGYAMILEELYYLKKIKASFYEIPYRLKMTKTTVSHFSYKPALFFSYFQYAVKSFFVF